MKRKLTIVVLFCILACLSAHQAYPLHKLPKLPVIDGRLDDYAWSRIPTARGFQIMDKAHSYATERLTSFQIGYLNDAIYLAIQCQEPNLKNIKAMKTYRDGWCMDEAVELFFIQKGQNSFLQLLANANGARWCKRDKANKEIEPPPDWKVAAGRTQDAWTLEMAIPFSLLDIRTPKDLTFNIGRNMPGAPKLKFQSWAKTLKGYGDQERFAKLICHNTNAPADLDMLNHEINRDYDSFLQDIIRQLASGERIWKEAAVKCRESEAFPKLQDFQRNLAQNWTRIPRADYAKTYSQWLSLLAKASTPVLRLPMKLTGQNLTVTHCHVNGTPQTLQDGNAILSLKEGVNVIALTVKAQDQAQFQPVCNQFPSLNARWAFSTALQNDWTQVSFDDRAWKPLPGILPKGTLYLRQLILWNKRHDGSFRALNPSVHRWMFSLDSTEPVYLSVYSPAGLRVNSYDFVLTLPKGFRLLDMEPGARRNRLSLAPQKVATRKTDAGTEYTLTYAPKDLHEWQSADSLLGIYKDATGKPGDTGVIPYARLINHNLTEIGGVLPYGILPKINGRQLKHMLMTYYMGGLPQALSDEFSRHVLKDSIRAGADTFSMYPMRDKLHDMTEELGGHVMLGYLNHPIWGSKFFKGAVTDLFRKHPDLFCLYYTGQRKSLASEEKKYAHLQEIQFCPSLFLGKYKREFQQAIRDDYQNIFFKNNPKSTYIFLNWEQEPWRQSIYNKATDPSKAFCFCPLCKENFRKWAKLPKTQSLENNILFTQFYEEWRQFRYTQDAAMHKVVADILVSMGKKAFFYSWSNHFGYWEAAKDNPYHVFLGCPGNGTADRRQQLMMDEYMDFHRKKLGRKNMSGQRFVFFPDTYGWNTTKREGWLKFNVMSEDGYIHPKTWKWQTVRILATLQGGYDLQNPLELVSGVKYYLGEATRMAAHYEDIFWNGTRQDQLAASKQIAYPDMMVLKHGDQRLVMLFNESQKPKEVTVTNLKLNGNEKAHAYYQNKPLDAKQFTITIPADDVEVVYIH